MSLDALTAKINQYVEEMELSTARVFIEENMTALIDHKYMLNKNARELFDFLFEQKSHGEEPMTRKNIAILNTINAYANRFDVRGIKRIVKDNPNLLLRRDTPAYLNADAKIILQGMGVI